MDRRPSPTWPAVDLSPSPHSPPPRRSEPVTQYLGTYAPKQLIWSQAKYEDAFRQRLGQQRPLANLRATSKADLSVLDRTPRFDTTSKPFNSPFGSDRTHKTPFTHQEPVAGPFMSPSEHAPDYVEGQNEVSWNRIGELISTDSFLHGASSVTPATSPPGKRTSPQLSPLITPPIHDREETAPDYFHASATAQAPTYGRFEQPDSRSGQKNLERSGRLQWNQGPAGYKGDFLQTFSDQRFPDRTPHAMPIDEFRFPTPLTSYYPNFQFQEPQQEQTSSFEPPVCTMYMHYTISEDRSGNQDSVTSQRLAALGSRRRAKPFMDDSDDHPTFESDLNTESNEQSGFEFGVDPSTDPELALALRMSMEEEKHRQESTEPRRFLEATLRGTVQRCDACRVENIPCVPVIRSGARQSCQNCSKDGKLCSFLRTDQGLHMAQPVGQAGFSTQGQPGGFQPTTSDNKALQEYQMQMMLLEQQNKKRLRMAGQLQDEDTSRTSRFQSVAPASSLATYEEQMDLLEQQNRERVRMARREQDAQLRRSRNQSQDPSLEQPAKFQTFEQQNQRRSRMARQIRDEPLRSDQNAMEFSMSAAQYNLATQNPQTRTRMIEQRNRPRSRMARQQPGPGHGQNQEQTEGFPTNSALNSDTLDYQTRRMTLEEQDQLRSRSTPQPPENTAEGEQGLVDAYWNRPHNLPVPGDNEKAQQGRVWDLPSSLSRDAIRSMNSQSAGIIRSIGR